MLTLSRTEEGSSCDLMKKTLRTAATARKRAEQSKGGSCSLMRRMRRRSRSRSLLTRKNDER